MDVHSGQIYPVFDVKRGSGTNGTFTYPDQDANAYPGGRRRNEFHADHDMMLLGTAGHLHPGGLHDDLWMTRPGAQPVSASTVAARCSKARARARRAWAAAAAPKKGRAR